jgi:hypothetical protein
MRFIVGMLTYTPDASKILLCFIGMLRGPLKLGGA